MDQPIVEPPLPANRISSKEVLDRFCQHVGIDPQTLPDADSVPPWTDEEAAAFKRVIDEAFEQIEEV